MWSSPCVTALPSSRSTATAERLGWASGRSRPTPPPARRPRSTSTTSGGSRSRSERPRASWSASGRRSRSCATFPDGSRVIREVFETFDVALTAGGTEMPLEWAPSGAAVGSLLVPSGDAVASVSLSAVATATTMPSRPPARGRAHLGRHPDVVASGLPAARDRRAGLCDPRGHEHVLRSPGAHRRRPRCHPRLPRRFRPERPDPRRRDRRLGAGLRGHPRRRDRLLAVRAHRARPRPTAASTAPSAWRSPRSTGRPSRCRSTSRLS